MVWLWDQAQRRFRSDLIHDPGTVDHLALSLDGSLLATAGEHESSVQLWEISSGKRFASPLPHPGYVKGLVFGPLGSNLLVTHAANDLLFWNTSTGRPYSDPPPVPGGVTAQALSPDGRTLASATAKGTVFLWAVPSQPPCQRLPLASIVPPGIASVEDNAAIATYSGDGLRLWSAETGQLLSRHPGPGRLVTGAFSEDGQYLVEWGGKDVIVWETRSGRPHGRPLHLSQPAVYAALSSHGTVLATMSRSGVVQLWDTTSQQERGSPLSHPSAGGILEFSPDEQLLATADASQIYVWETATGHLRVPPIRLAGAPRWVTYSPDSHTLAAVNQRGDAVTLWSTATGRQCLRPLAHPAPVERGAFSPNGKMLATLTNDNALRLWDLTSGRHSGRLILPGDEVEIVRFSPDSNRLVTGSKVGARLWDVATCQLIGRPLLTSEPVSDARFGLNGSILALSAGRPKSKVYLCHLPAAPAGSAPMKLLTAAALGVGPDPEGNSEVVPWRKWRDLHEQSLKYYRGIKSAARSRARSSRPARGWNLSGIPN
jgi:WD40 repeat protein